MGNPASMSPNFQCGIRSVCAIMSGPHQGTGVLIGPDLVLTAYHVLAHVKDEEDIKETVCIFDYFELPGVPTGSGKEVGVLEVDICCSPPSPGDLEGGPPVFKPDQLDYRILRLNHKIGLRPANDQRIRGWVHLPSLPDVPFVDDTIYLFQHPGGSNFLRAQTPLRYDTGQVMSVLHDVPGNDARYTHDVDTGPGSSGGPCFNLSKDFAFVGLHNAGHRKGDTKEKRFVPLLQIVRHIQRTLSGNGIIGELFKEPPALDQPAATNDVDVARRRSVALWLMDRTTEEIKFRRKFGMESTGSQIAQRVHLIVCHEDDKPDLFAKRLEHLPLYPTERQRRETLMDGLAKGELARTFDSRPCGWPALESEERRKDEIDTLVSDLDIEGRQLIVFGGTYEDGMDEASEGALLNHLATKLNALLRGTSSNLQCLVYLVVPERPDTITIVEKFANLWTDTSAPPGCGICIQLTEIALADLNNWRDVLENTWGQNEAFSFAIRSLYLKGTRHRMARLVEKLGDGIDQLIRAGGTGGMGRQP